MNKKPRKQIGNMVSQKVGEIIDVAQKQVVRTAIEALLQKGAVVNINNMEINITDPERKPILNLNLTGTLTVSTQQQQEKREIPTKRRR